jgi:polysaccharide export outer membrane protein
LQIFANKNGILNRTQRRTLILLSCLVALTAGLAPTIVCAQLQGVNPTPEQLEMFRNLPADQQQALMQQFGGVLGTQGSSGLPGALGGTRPGQTGRDGTDQTNPDQQRGATGTGEPPEPAIPVLKPDDWVVVEVDFHLAARAATAAGAGATPPESGSSGSSGGSQQQSATPSPVESERSEEEEARLRKLIDLIRSRNPYQLSREGVLYLPGFAGIALAGLIEDLATLRLKVEPALSSLDLRVTRLPLNKTGPEGLKPFGYDLFLKSPSTFAPVTNVPVPSDYVVGAGDQLQVQLYGTQNRTLWLQVGRDGRVSFPELGPISVSGLRFTEVSRHSLDPRVCVGRCQSPGVVHDQRARHDNLGPVRGGRRQADRLAA